MGELALLSPGGEPMTVKPAWQQRLSSNNQGWVQQMCEAGLGGAVLAAAGAADVRPHGAVAGRGIHAFWWW